MAHSRAEVFRSASPRTDAHRRSMLAYIRLLYDVEREARDRSCRGEARRALRQDSRNRSLDDIRAYLERRTAAGAAQESGGQAIAYTLSNWKALTRYCEDGDLEIGRVGMWRGGLGSAYLFPAFRFPVPH